jgi:tetratricopeptide (TPR) repeat protein
MPDIKSAAPPKVTPRFYDHIRALLRAGKNDQAIARACAIAVIVPDDLLAKELLFNGFFQKRDWLPALAVANELVQRQPGVARLESFLITTLANLKRYDEAIAHAFEYITRYGEDVAMLDALKVAHFYTGKLDEAIRFGQRAIELQDAAVCRTTCDATVREPKGPPTGRNVISFSLWGSNPVYCYGAMINLVLSRIAYPGWTCRYYIDAAVPKRCVAYLRENGAETFNIEDAYPNTGQFQRFLVMNDSTVSRFVVRDCDARLSQEEAKLVDEWIDSDEWFHVIRGHILHNVLMMAGLWGGRTDTGIDIVALIRRYLTAGPMMIYGEDQRMLGSMLWPLIRAHCLMHDKYYSLPGIHGRGLPDLKKSHFGASRQNLNAVRGEAEQLGIPREL